MKKFDGIVSTKTDLSSVYKVITTELPPTKFKPFEEIVEPVKQSLVLIGGDGSGYWAGHGVYDLARRDVRPVPQARLTHPHNKALTAVLATCT